MRKTGQAQAQGEKGEADDEKELERTIVEHGSKVNRWCWGGAGIDWGRGHMPTNLSFRPSTS